MGRVLSCALILHLSRGPGADRWSETLPGGWVWEQAQQEKIPSSPGPYSLEPQTNSPPGAEQIPLPSKRGVQSTPRQRLPRAERHRSFLAGRLAHGAQRQPVVPAISSLGTSHMRLFHLRLTRILSHLCLSTAPSQESHKDVYTRLHRPGPHKPLWVSLSRTPAGVFTSGLTPEAWFPVLG